MSEYQNFGEGALFKNNRKTQETDFDYSGEITINKETRWLNAWINESQAGNKYMKVVIGNVKQPKEQNVVQSAPQAVTPDVTTVNDKIPF